MLMCLDVLFTDLILLAGCKSFTQQSLKVSLIWCFRI